MIANPFDRSTTTNESHDVVSRCADGVGKVTGQHSLAAIHDPYVNLAKMDISWDGGPDELATTRTFDIVLQVTSKTGVNRKRSRL